MPSFPAALLALIPFILPSHAQQPSPALAKCPLLGPQYPVPTAIATSPTFLSTTANLTDTLDSILTTAPFNTTSFSLSVFSTASDSTLDEDLLAWQYHHTTPLLASSTQGTQNLDADSIYRIASISKLMTVYLFLIEVGDGHWADPVAKWLPELEQLGEKVDAERAKPNWTEITLGDLAGQTSGLVRDYGQGDLSLANNGFLPEAVTQLLPEVPATDVPDCGYLTANGTSIQCTEEQYLHGIASTHTIFPPSRNAVYSNVNFALLGLVLSRMTNKTLAQLFTTHLVEGLNLNGASYTVPSPLPPDAIVPVNTTISGWDSELGISSPSGANYASTSDLAKIGRAILQSKLLPQALTRRWLTPHSFVNGLDQGVGKPWEILRLQIAGGRTVDVYTKSGDWGSYSTLFALVPDYDMGFTVLTALDPGSPTGLAVGGTVRSEVANLIARPVVEAVDAVAKAQAATHFAGRYTDPASNSSVTLKTDEDSALRLTSWVYNGTDLLNGIVTTVLPDVDWRLLPNNLYAETGKVGFTSLYQAPAPDAVFYGPCFDWTAVDPVNFGSVPLGQFVFDVDSEGGATGVESKGLRIRMERAN